MRKMAGTLALVVLGFGLALVIAAVGIRIANHWFPYFYCYDEYRGWALRPGARGWYRREGKAYVRINRDGFRGPDYSKDKPPGVVRIAVVGDSYAEAIQVAEDKTFVAVAGRMLADCPALKGKRVEAMNFGVDGYGTAQELLTLRRRVWAYSPDIVALAIFVGNDIRNNSVALESNRCRPFYLSDKGQLRLAGPMVESRSFKLWCMARFDYRDLRILDLLRNGWEIITSRLAAPIPERPAERAINYNVYKPPQDRAWKNAWQVTEQLIEAVHQDVQKHGAMFLAVTEDTGIQVWPEAGVRERFEKQLGVTDFFYPDRRIVALGRRNGFDVLTLAGPLQNYALKHHRFLHGFENTPMGFGHWNETGHEAAGRLLAQRLCEMISAGQCRSCGAR